MPPKKGKNAKKGKKEPPVEPATQPEVALQPSTTSLDLKEMNLPEDLNDEFFAAASKTIKTLMEANRTYEASKIKKYVDILFVVNRQYADEIKENETLRPLVVKGTEQFRKALQLTATQTEALQHLKEALGEAWSETDASLQREQNIQTILQQVLFKCEEFSSKEVKDPDDPSEFGPLAKYKNIIMRERDRLSGELLDHQKRIQLQRLYSESLEYINKTNLDLIQKCAVTKRKNEADIETLTVKITQLTNNLDDQKDNHLKTLSKLEFTNRELNDIQKKLQRKIIVCARQKVILDKYRSESLTCARQRAKNEEELTLLRKLNQEHEETIKRLHMEQKEKERNMDQMTKKFRKAKQDFSTISTRLYTMNRVHSTRMEEIASLKNKISSLEKDVRANVQKAEDFNRQKENVTRERDSLRCDIIDLNNVIADLRHLSAVQNNATDFLHLEINKLNVKLDESKFNISKANTERDEMIQEVVTLNDRLDSYEEQLKFKTDHITNLTEKLEQKMNTLTIIKKQLETVHSNKMMLERSLESTTQERDNFRALQMKTTHQISQLTNEITVNLNKMIAYNLKIERLNIEKKDLIAESNNKDLTINGLRTDVKNIKIKNENLLRTISEDELKFLKISHELEETRKERNLIGLQMVRRNDEIVILKERITIMQSALDQGQTQYNQRSDDIRILKVEISNLSNERDCLRREVKSNVDMRAEVVHLQRVLNQERIKVRALEDDAKIPIGVHRWRIIRGKDPSKFELIEKMQMMQRRNLKQAILKSSLETKLKIGNTRINTLEHMVLNIPNKNIMERLVATQNLNRKKERQIKALNAELEIAKIEATSHEALLQHLKEELREAQQKLFQIEQNPVRT